MVCIGIIGGSGLDNPDIFKNARDINIKTPFGFPSSSIKSGKIGGVNVRMIARHGRLHTIPPTNVPFRANISALKQEGCTHILATTAVGSLRSKIQRGDLIILDQFIDFTRRRDLSFYDEFKPHSPIHIPMAEPFDKSLRQILLKVCEKNHFPFHSKGTVITIEGPRFSTRAESNMFRLWGADVINMSIAPECALANEANIPYAAVAMSTDYDCWKQDEEPVTWDAIKKIFGENVDKVTKLLIQSIQQVK